MLMLNAGSMFSVLFGLSLMVACNRRAEPEDRDGYLELVVCADGTESQMPSIRLSINRLDRSFDTRVELPNEGGRVVVDLRAGLYAVDGAPGTASSDALDAVTPVLSSPALVVVAAGHFSSLYVRTKDAALPGASALATLDAPR